MSLRSSRRRVLLVSPLPPPPGGIASWTAFVRDAPAIRERFEVEVFNTAPRETVAVHGGSRLRAARALDALRMIGAARRRLREFRPDVVHVNTSYFWAFYRDGLIARLAQRAGARALLHFRGGDLALFVEQAPSPARAWILRTLARMNGLVALTRETQRWLEATAAPDRVHYLPNFVPLTDPAARAPRAATKTSPLELLFVGWMVEAKGVRELLDAVAAIPELRLTMVGPGDPAFVSQIRPRLERLAGRVRWLGPLPQEKVRELYDGSDLFVLPTWREGFPNVVVEAMERSLPIVTTPVGAIPDAIADQREGVLVPVRQPAALARALRELLDDPERRASLGAAARARVEREFGADAVLAQLSELWTDLAE